MIRLRLIYNNHNRYFEVDDSKRIVKIFRDHNYEISLNDAINAWRTHSQQLASSWLILPDDDERLFDIMFQYFEAVDDDI